MAADGPVDSQPDTAVRGGSSGPDTQPHERNAVVVAATPDLADRVERLELGMLRWFTRLEEQATAHDAALEARLEKLEARLTAAHDASVEAVGLLAGHLVARFEEQVEGLESAIDAWHQRFASQLEAGMAQRHTELVTRLEADRSDRGATLEALGALASGLETDRDELLEAISGLASGQLVDRLLEGVVALGEVLDADLVNLRRLINQGNLTPRQEPTQPEQAVDGAGGVDEGEIEGEVDGEVDEPFR